MRRVRVYGIADPKRLEERDPTFSFKLQNMSDQAVVEHLWTKHGIALRADNFYSRVPEVYEVPSMIRVSLVHYNTPEEIGRLLKGISELDQP
jgi:selenocysteine lyase/cysteine desulfurase